MTCPACGNFARREPAIVVCIACGRHMTVLDATEPQFLAQRVLDYALRPISAECLPEYNVPRPLGWQPGRRGETRLPGEAQPKSGRPARKATGD